MRKGNIEFEPIYVTKATREAIRDVAETGDMSEEDFVHMALAFFLKKKVEREIKECDVVLRGESVEDDFETLKSGWKDRGSNMRYAMYGNYGESQLGNAMEAMSLFFDWMKEGQEDVAVDIEKEKEKFELFKKNLSYEQELMNSPVRRSLSLRGIAGEATGEEFEELRIEEEKYRQEKGYLLSEIPPGLGGGIQMHGDPEIFRLLELGQKMLSEPSWDTVVAFLVAWQMLKKAGKKKLEEAKKKLVEVIGEDRVKEIWEIIRSRVTRFVDKKIEKWSDDEGET